MMLAVVIGNFTQTFGRFSLIISKQIVFYSISERQADIMILFKAIYTFLGLEYGDTSLKTLFLFVIGISISKIR